MSRPRTWPVTAFAFLTAVTLCLAQSPRVASAQQPSVAPDELTQAILRFAFRHEGGNARLLAGRVPDDLEPNFYAPPGTRVLGSVEMGSSVLVLAKSSTSPDSLRPVYTRALQPRGWKPQEMMRRGGFVDAHAQLPLILCRDGAQLHIQQLTRSGGSHDLFLHYREAGGSCEQPAVTFRAMSEPPPFPTLYAPPNAGRESSMRCMSRTSGRRGLVGTTTTLAAANMSAEEVLRHYAGQLESSGWRPVTGGGRSLATGTWTRADSTGTTELKLQVRETAPPGLRCYHVDMNVSDAR